jgi:hypothetical protein
MMLMKKDDKPLGAIIVARAGAPGGPPTGDMDEESGDEDSKMAEKAKMAATDALFRALESKDHKAFADAFSELSSLCDDDSMYEKKDEMPEEKAETY